MAEEQLHSPGTVSKILWHFTGGPRWNPKTKTQGTSAKPAADAYKSIRSILQSREIRLGGYKELVKVILPERLVFDSQAKKLSKQKNVPVEIESSAICCLSDIPAPHLGYHADRYGKFALGFHRSAVVKAGFNPVFYSLHDTPILASIYEGFSSLRYADPSIIQSAVSDIENEVENIQADFDELDIDLSSQILDIESEADHLDSVVQDARHSLEDFVALVKTFGQDEFTTIYCEREWRSTSTYAFDFNDLAMIVLPRAVNRRKYFEPFVERIAQSLKVPRRIPIVPWEDLVEH